MKFHFNLTVEVAREKGKPASKDEIAKAILDLIEDADPGELFTDEEAKYAIETWNVKEWRPK